MAIAVVQQWTGTADQYMQITQKLGLTPGGPSPEGGLFHWSMEIDDNTMQSTDIWTDRESADAFYERIADVVKELGLDDENSPEVKSFEVLNYFTAGPEIETTTTDGDTDTASDTDTDSDTDISSETTDMPTGQEPGQRSRARGRATASKTTTVE